MTFTRHGHHIDGTTTDDEVGLIPIHARCGGPAICTQCAIDANQIKNAPVDDNAAQNKFYEDTSTYDQPTDIFLTRAKLAVIGSYNSTHEAPDQLSIDKLYIVWFAKVLKNWKALISTTVRGDGLYFEVTYNGNPGLEETYVDTYRKEDNQAFSNHDQ